MSIIIAFVCMLGKTNIFAESANKPHHNHAHLHDDVKLLQYQRYDIYGKMPNQ